MKNAFMIVVLLAAWYPCATPLRALAALNPLTHCGTERWHIKTLDDAGVNHIHQTAKKTTISALRALTVPSGFSRTNDISRYAPPERNKYTVTALVMGFKQEADRDFHVVLADPVSKDSMIAEIPDPNCSTVQESGHADQISAARSAFIACFGQPPAGNGFKHLTGSATLSVTGVGFFDFVHTPAQIGVAPNAFELHPVLSIRKTGGTCPTGYSARCACTVERRLHGGETRKRRERSAAASGRNPPRLIANDTVDRYASLRLIRTHGRFGVWTKVSIDGASVKAAVL